MKSFAFRSFFATTFLAFGTLASAVSIPASFSAQVEEDEIDAFGTEIDQAFFNVQGDDDGFTVYSLADFSTAGIGPISSVSDLTLDLTQSNAFFTADGELEFFLASDTREVTLDDTARFLSDQSVPGEGNVGAEVVGAAFGTLFPLGSGTFTETASGDTDTFALTLDAAGEAFFLSQVASGGILRIIVTPGDLGVQATLSGAASLLDPPSPPVLSFVVPEPVSALLVLVGGPAACLVRRRS